MSNLTLFSVIDSKMDGRYSKFVLPFIALSSFDKAKGIDRGEND